ncbi:MAG: alpha-L-fucosidase [Bacteroidota bacterium]|nr:alpha-L-fucosidase [Bacteroidota bacterium]
MEKIFILALVSIGLDIGVFAQHGGVLPTPEQVNWIDKEIGVIIHLDINIYAPATFDYAKKETLPSLSVFNPSKLNTDQWIMAAKSAGATYAVLTVKHGTGFCLWKTKMHPYNVGSTPFRDGNADIVADFINSCRKYEIKPGFYYNTNMNTYYQAGYIPMSDENRLKYNEIVYHQLEELWSGYGKLFEIWFDGGIMTDRKIGIQDKVRSLLKKYQSRACLFQGPPGARNILRWVENEDGRTPYPFWSRINATVNKDGKEVISNGKGDPDGRFWVSAEADFPNRKQDAWNGGWLWKAGEENKVFTAEELLERYYTSVGNNTNMLIGMAIDTSGLFPSYDTKVFEDFGAKLKERKKSKAGTISGNGYSFVIKFKSPTEINQIEILENVKNGERIRSYRVEAFINGGWQKICEGVSVGHKRIQSFEQIESGSVRLIITAASEKPAIKAFSAYNY